MVSPATLQRSLPCLCARRYKDVRRKPPHPEPAVPHRRRAIRRGGGGGVARSVWRGVSGRGGDRKAQCETARARAGGQSTAGSGLSALSSERPGDRWAGRIGGWTEWRHVKRDPTLWNARPASRYRCEWRRVAWPERGLGRPVRNPWRKAKKRCRLHGGGTVLTVTGSTR